MNHKLVRSVRQAILWAAAMGIALCASAADGVARRVEERLIAPCCWSESVAVHRSGDAAEMRAEIERLVAQGESEERIAQLYVDRYGERILLEPRGSKAGWLRAIPWACFALGVAALLVGLRRRRSTPVEAAQPVAGPVTVPSREEWEW